MPHGGASMKSNIWTICFILFFQFTTLSIVHAQRLPFFTHYFDNPYLYNPAYAGYDKHTVIYLTHRQQWMGVEGAPVSTQLSFHTPLGNANPLFIGGDIMNDQLGALNHTAVKFSSAYMIPLSAENEHYIKAALSAGLGMYSFDLGDMAIGDDVVLQAAMNNTTFLDGRFGLHYHNQGFNLSASLPHLFVPPAALSEGIGNAQFDQLSRMIFSAHYRFQFSPDSRLSFEPTTLYHYHREGESQLEGMGVFYYRSRESGERQKDLFWFGGSYQQQSGVGGMAGVRINNLKFSYAFSTGGSPVSAYGMGSHEVQLAFVIGKKKVTLKRKPRLRTGRINEEVPDEALMKKHAKSIKKNKDNKETVPDRKRVTQPDREEKTAEPVTKDSNLEISEQTQIVSEEAVSQPGQPTSGTPESVSDQNAVAPSNTASQTQQQSERKASSSEEKDYSNMSFDSFKSSDEDIIQLGQNEQDNPESVGKEAEAPSEESPGNLEEDMTNHPLMMQGGYYIIAGTFSAEANAERLANKLKKEGHDAAVGYHQEKQYFYVYAAQAASNAEAQQALQMLKQSPDFKNAWILKVNAE